MRLLLKINNKLKKYISKVQMVKHVFLQTLYKQNWIHIWMTDSYKLQISQFLVLAKTHYSQFLSLRTYSIPHILLHITNIVIFTILPTLKV